MRDLVAAMRLKLEELGHEERLTEQLDERLFVGALIEVAYSLIQEIQATLTRPQHAVVGRDVQMDGATQMTVVAVVHHLHVNQQQQILWISPGVISNLSGIRPSYPT